MHCGKRSIRKKLQGLAAGCCLRRVNCTDGNARNVSGVHRRTFAGNIRRSLRFDWAVQQDRHGAHAEYAICRGSEFRFSGGDGVIREIEFLEPLQVSLLTQRRKKVPFGLMGGENGLPGKNILKKKSGEIIILEPLAQIKAEQGDIIEIHTPGGGGFGKLSEP